MRACFRMRSFASFAPMCSIPDMNDSKGPTCFRCRYDLRASLESDVCPECGLSMPEALVSPKSVYASDLSVAFLVGGLLLLASPYVFLDPPRDDLIEFGTIFLGWFCEALALLTTKRMERRRLRVSILLVRIVAIQLTAFLSACCIAVLIVLGFT